jgi:PPOX class probable F420-dependent enzyme
MTTPTVPATHVDLLEKPLFAHLATIRPDGAPQSSVMWFGWDGSRVKFTHTRTRQKFRNLAHDARVAFSIRDEANPYRFLEVAVKSSRSSPRRPFYVTLQRRYASNFRCSTPTCASSSPFARPSTSR